MATRKMRFLSQGSLMFMAHLPAGYLLTRFIGKERLSRKALAAGLFGSIAPDLDLIRFYYLDGRQVHHHEYWTHVPAVWLMTWFIIWITHRFRGKTLPLTWMCFFACGLLHLFLDTIAGEIMWFWPLSEYSEAWVTVPATHSPWYMSFVHHWTFKLEIAISLTALVVAIRS